MHRATPHTVAPPAPGFSLIELLVTVAIVAVLAGLALPNFREMNLRSNATTVTNDLVAALSLARTEAVKRGMDAEVIATSGGSWNNGWQVRVDTARNGLFNAPDSLLMTYPAITSGYTVSSVATGAGGQPDRFVFNGYGAIKTSTGTGGTLNVCRPANYKKDTQSRRINIGATGVVNARRDTTGSPAPACP